MPSSRFLGNERARKKPAPAEARGALGEATLYLGKAGIRRARLYPRCSRASRKRSPGVGPSRCAFQEGEGYRRSGVPIGGGWVESVGLVPSGQVSQSEGGPHASQVRSP